LYSDSAYANIILQLVFFMDLKSSDAFSFRHLVCD
jgi:hypothetical protein